MFQQTISSGSPLRIGDIDPISTRDLENLNDWNCAELGFVDDTIHWAIERQMKRQPESSAMCFGDQEISYGVLDAWSAALACHLRVLGVRPEKIVPLCFDKSIWAIVSVVAVLRAGGTCTALDPKYPAQRLCQIIENTDADLVLGSSEHTLLFEGSKVNFIGIDEAFLGTIKQLQPVALEKGSVKPTNAAFVVFTSGSTGTPKGIILEHASICATSRHNKLALELSSSSRVIQFASFVFDVAIEDICITLMHGACICIVSEHNRLNDLSGTMSAMAVTFADLTPTVARTIDADAVPSLKTLVLGGEVLGDDIIKQWADKVHLFNTYGPAECSIYSTATGVLNRQARGSNIGWAIGCKCWVADQNDHNKPVSVGCVGELLIEGPNVARAYLKDDEKTRNAFVFPAWLVDAHGSRRRCYKTGNLVKHNRDGSLDFVARKDSQVKLHGQRVELEEIETQILVKGSKKWTAVVEVFSSATNLTQMTLAMFFWPTKSLWNAQASSTSLIEMTQEMQSEMLDLKNELMQVLPTYMVPSAYIPLQCMPTTSSGKINRRALRNIGEDISNTQMMNYSLSLSTQEKTQPRNQKETVLQDRWATVLNTPSDLIGVEDSFFHLGGESIAAIKLAAAARRLDLRLTVADIFRHPVLSDMTSSIEYVQQDKTASSTFSQGSQLTNAIIRKYNLHYDSIQDIYNCTWLQKDMIEVTRLKHEANTLRCIAQIGVSVDLGRYCAAWELVIAQSPIFRTRIVNIGNDEARQVVCEEKIEWEDATSLKKFVQKDKARIFDYGTKLVRFAIASEGAERDFVWTAHHSTYDGWSLTQVLETVARLYKMPSSTQASPPFKDLVRYIDKMDKPAYETFWNSELHGFRGQPFPPMPTPSYKPLTHSSHQSTMLLPKRSSQEITISSLIRAALALVIGAHTNNNDVCFGAIQTGRSIPLPGVADIVGPVITLVPLRIVWNSFSTVSCFLRTIQDQSASMIPYEHIGKDKIAAVSADCASACAFQTLLIVQPVEQKATGIEGVTQVMTPYPEFMTYGMSIECKLGKDEATVHVDYDEAVLSISEVETFVGDLERMILALCSEDGNAKTMAVMTMVKVSTS